MASKKLQKKSRSPYALLLLTALALPAFNSLVFGTLMLVTHYFGNFYAYTFGGTILTVLYEIVSSIFAIVKHCSLVMTLMTIGSCVLLKKEALTGFFGALFAAVLSLGEVVASVLALVLTVSLGISDSTLALANQLLGLLPVSALRVLSALIFCLLALPIYMVPRLFAQKDAEKAEGKSAFSSFMITSLVIVGLYTLYLFIDPITVVLTPASGGNFLNNYLLPLIYPLIYGGFAVLTAFKFPELLSAYYRYRFLVPKRKKEQS